MKENKYDNQIFFQKYSQMDRSRKGLEGAGEWHTLKPLMPDFKGRRVLDLGCGYGWHCIYAARAGAASVTGIDISEKMLRVAREKTAASGFANIIYQNMPMEDIDFPEAGFDVILSSLAFHYVEDFQGLVDKLVRILAPGGTFIFSVEHPVFTSQGPQDWYYDEKGKILHFPVDHYYYEGKRQAVFLGEPVVKYHRTLTTYVTALLSRGLILQALQEPQPPAEMLDIPGMEDEFRRPMILILKAQKI